MAIDADRHVGFLIRRQLLEQHDRRPVEIGHVGLEDFCADPVPGHQFVVVVAFGADLRREQVEW